MIGACKSYEYFYILYNVISDIYNKVYCIEYFITVYTYCTLRMQYRSSYTDCMIGLACCRSLWFRGNTWRTIHVSIYI